MNLVVPLKISLLMQIASFQDGGKSLSKRLKTLLKKLERKCYGRHPPPHCDFRWKAVDAVLPATDGKSHSLLDCARKNRLVVVFICNHCPYVVAVIDRIVRDAKDLHSRGIGFVAISSNDVAAYP